MTSAAGMYKYDSDSSRDDNDDSSAYSSDDDYLTTSKGNGSSLQGGEDREAMIRKKLLESFYGTGSTDSPTAAANSSIPSPKGNVDKNFKTKNFLSSGNSNASKSVDTSKASNLNPTTSHSQPSIRSSTSKSAPTAPTSGSTASAASSNVTNLDSQYFSCQTHTKTHISSMTTQSLLETDEKLAMSIRLLDSTMQTLVYENYSKFIDATDAIRSIGKSATSSSAGLTRLTQGIQKIETYSTSLDSQLRQSREAVAEKLRVKRLLSRLSFLLKLPSTLKNYISAGKYRLAAQSHFDAIKILERHSEGFESLKSIEGECSEIVGKMISMLRQRLLLWSGNHNERNRILLILEKEEEEEEEGRKQQKERKYTSNSNEMNDFEISNDDEDSDGLNDHDVEYKDYRTSASFPLGISASVPPPTSIAEIFECAGALLMFTSRVDSKINTRNNNSNNKFSSHLTEDKCKLLALECCTKFMEGILEEYAVDMQEASLNRRDAAVTGSMHFGDSKDDDDLINEDTDDANNKHASANNNDAGGSSLVPNDFLDCFLEVATLYGVTFRHDNSDSNRMKSDDMKLLSDFVSKMFASFLGQVRTVLLERSMEQQRNQITGDGGGSNSSLPFLSSPSRSLSMASIDGNEEDDNYNVNDNDEAFSDISHALTHLLRSVRELASGLALPEVGLDMEIASSLVEKTVGITEEMVRKRVAQKFYGLRLKVLRDCIVPFVMDAIIDEQQGDTGAGTTNFKGNDIQNTNDDSDNVVQKVQLANVALSDSMQLVDDAIRSILSRDSELGSSSTPIDSEMVKAAVVKNARKFSAWLANSLEVLAGWDPVVNDMTLDVNAITKKEDEDGTDVSSSANLGDAFDVLGDDTSKASSWVGTTIKKESADEKMLNKVVLHLQEKASDAAYADLTLAIVEMCRLAERNVSDNMNQSIASSTEEDTKAVAKAMGVFVDQMKKGKVDVDSNRAVSSRFELAASRALILYASSKGADAAAVGCSTIFSICSMHSDAFPVGPQKSALEILEVAKRASIDCANAFGGEKMAGPVPSFSDERAGTASSAHLTHRTGGVGNHMSAIKGLQLDVARMFTEKVQIFPHPMQLIEFTRDAVVATVFKIAFKALIEQSRLCTFTTFSYRQMQVDVEFLRHMIPHYIRREFAESVDSMLNDVILNVGERCVDMGCVGVTEYYDDINGKILTPLTIAEDFFLEEEAAGSRGANARFVIVDE